MGVAAIAPDEVVPAPERAGEEAAPKRAVRHKRDAELAQQRDDLRLKVARPQRIFRLHGRERVDRMRAADGVGAGLAQAEVAHLALLDEARHGADRLLDRRLRIDAVLVVDVDVIDAEPLETRLARDRDVVGPAVDEAALAVWSAHVAELRGDQHLVAPAAEGLAEKFLVLAEAIGIGGVEQRDAKFDRPMNGRGGFGIVRYPVIGTHARAPEPDRRDTG